LGNGFLTTLNHIKKKGGGKNVVRAMATTEGEKLHRLEKNKNHCKAKLGRTKGGRSIENRKSEKKGGKKKSCQWQKK